QRKHVVPESLDLGCALQEIDDGCVAAGPPGVFRVTSRVRKRPAIEHVPSSVTGLVRGRSLAIAEARDVNREARQGSARGVAARPRLDDALQDPFQLGQLD